MAESCRWCPRPVLRTIDVDGGEGAPVRMALCDRHVMAVERARAGAAKVDRQQRRQAEMDAWQRAFREPPPFGSTSA